VIAAISLLNWRADSGDPTTVMKSQTEKVCAGLLNFPQDIFYY
jgi:hypothetical protein